MSNIVIVGAGGFGREVLDIFDALDDNRVLGFLSDGSTPGDMVLNRKSILGGIDWLKDKKDVEVICAIGTPEIRFRVVSKIKNEYGSKFCNAIHPSTIKTPHVSFGEGVVIPAGCILTNNITIGNHVHLNLDTTVGHDAIIEDFVTIAPGVHVSGNVVLGIGTYIGTGANLIEKKSVGEWSIIGAGATVVKDIPANTTAVGSPAKVIKTREKDWHL